MIIGIGVDLVYATRLQRWQAIPGLLERYFHPEELRTALSRGRGAALSLAARFAAKEALGKALGSGLSGLVLRDIMVAHQPQGAPELRLFGTARRALEQRGASRVHLSLTHEKDYALAMVVLEAQ
ncbi:MAG: holo-ACP synthase [Spirochaetaceae bacterium]|jgi:holo-[acyl-carrier protein] synthase|nr:holo-ACP synthase [Spirochaetaceae bacterium]